MMCTINNRVESERLRAGWTQQELADAIGVGRATIQKWEQGDLATVSSADALRMSECFCCSIDYLLGLCEKRTQTRV